VDATAQAYAAAPSPVRCWSSRTATLARAVLVRRNLTRANTALGI
jgi:hypothetical protein